MGDYFVFVGGPVTLDDIAKILAKYPPKSAKYKEAMANLDKILGMKQEPETEDNEVYDESEEVD